MPLSIEQIEKAMAAGELLPRQVADFRVYLSALYSLHAGEMKLILTVKPKIWLSLRDGTKSDTAADRMWEARNEGIREMQLKWDMRRIEKLNSALSTMMNLLEGEAKNQW